MGALVNVLGTPCEAFHCINCGVAFTVPSAVVNLHREKGGFHHCPNGHAQGWPKEGSENARLIRERDRLIQQAARKDDELREANAATAKARADAARLRKRAAAGSCPCCRRNFTNMARHMKTKHPEFAADNVVAIKGKAA